MAETRNTRVTTLLKTLEMNASELAVRMGKQPSTIYRITNGDNEPTRTTLRAIAEATGASLEWLLTGKGERMDPKWKPGSGQKNTSSGDPELIAQLNEMITQLRSDKSRLEKENDRLWQIIAQKALNLPDDKAANFNQGLQLSGAARVIQIHTTAPALVSPTGTN